MEVMLDEKENEVYFNLSHLIYLEIKCSIITQTTWIIVKWAEFRINKNHINFRVIEIRIQISCRWIKK